MEFEEKVPVREEGIKKKRSKKQRLKDKSRMIEKEVKKEEKRKMDVEVEKLADDKRKKNIKQRISLAEYRRRQIVVGVGQYEGGQEVSEEAYNSDTPLVTDFGE